MEYGAIQSYNTRKVPAATEISPSFLAAGANLFCGALVEDGRETGRERVVVAAAATLEVRASFAFFRLPARTGDAHTDTHTQRRAAGRTAERGRSKKWEMNKAKGPSAKARKLICSKITCAVT